MREHESMLNGFALLLGVCRHCIDEQKKMITSCNNCKHYDINNQRFLLSKDEFLYFNLHNIMERFSICNIVFHVNYIYTRSLNIAHYRFRVFPLIYHCFPKAAKAAWDSVMIEVECQIKKDREERMEQ